jgi:hypothetical protein
LPVSVGTDTGDASIRTRDLQQTSQGGLHRLGAGLRSEVVRLRNRDGYFNRILAGNERDIGAVERVPALLGGNLLTVHPRDKIPAGEQK